MSRGRERDVLDAFAVVGVEVFLDLRLVVRGSLIGMRILPQGW
jgi:hypothetical protein